MNFQEATEYSNTVPWKTSYCGEGEDCWCRLIVPIDEIFSEKGEEIYIAGSGSIGQEHAERIVAAHNKMLEYESASN